MVKKQEKTVKNSILIKHVVELVNASRKQALKQTNTLIVFTYFQLGCLIVENEQKGKERAAYGKEIINHLSEKLTKVFGKGFSVDNLENMRSFYQVFKHKFSSVSISETLSRKSFIDLFPLSWSHYVVLCKIKNQQERSFYEIESIQEHWSVREPQRQFDGSLYERLTLSKDKKKIKELAKKGQVIERPEDVLKSSYILEFLGLESKSSYTETDLETAIISKIEHFLIEMGKGFLFQGRQTRFV
jgi:predicted nuclease of restriction endonuclease-like (RecB) superfamily